MHVSYARSAALSEFQHVGATTRCARVVLVCTCNTLYLSVISYELTDVLFELNQHAAVYCVQHSSGL